MRLNNFQVKSIELWNKYKTSGVLIEAGRQMGKTTLVLHIANIETNKDTAVIVYGFNEQATRRIQDINEHTYLVNIEKKPIYFVSRNNPKRINVMKHARKNFSKVIQIYDEPYLGNTNISKHPEPNTLKVFTEKEDGIFRFNEDWYDGSTFSNKTMLAEQEEILNEENFASQFNSCNIKRERN